MGNGMPKTYINAGALIMVEELVSDAFKIDALDVSLYVQLAASKKHPKFIEFEAWFKTYLNAMTQFGWMISARSLSSGPVEDNQPLELWSRIKQTLEARVPAPLISRAESIVMRNPGRFPKSAARSLLGEYALRSEPWQGDLKGTATQLSSVVLQLSFVDNTHLMTSVFISFKTTEPVEAGGLLCPVDPGRIVGNIEVGSFSAQLLDIRYNLFREQFVSALGARRSSLILPLEEATP
jgi:hypothetical protein